MARLSDLKKRLAESAEAASALADLTEFVTIVTIGTTASGGVLTFPLIVAQSGKTASALLRLARLLLQDGRTETAELDPAERADEIFYVFAQRAFLLALRRLEGKVPKRKIDRDKLQKMLQGLEHAAVKPDNAEAAFQFGWTPLSAPLQLYESYKTWLVPHLLSAGVEQKLAVELLEGVNRAARKGLLRELSSMRDDRRWMIDYQLLASSVTIIDLLKRFPVPTSNPTDASWRLYLEGLAKRPTLPIWGEEAQGIGIDRLFVEPQYEYARQLPVGAAVGRPAESTGLRAFLTGLLSRRRPSTELVFVMGGPGTGKTSLLDVLCAELASAGTVPIVSVPAKRLDPTRPLLPEVQKYLRETGYGSIAEIFPSTEDCILAIDGFDELAYATLSTLEAFFRSAQELVRERNATRLRILLSGRPTLFADNDVSIPSGAHIITLRPFDESQVAQWSVNWRDASGGAFDGTSYLKSANRDIRDLATQPMLLYLLAKMHEQDKPIAADLPETGGVRFRVYSEILDWVCTRQEHKQQTAEESVRLRRFLQIAGLATHQSGRRTLHWSQFKRALEQAGLAEPKEVDAKAHSTILAFAFTSVQHRSWEFTHKSFGEALASEAIGRLLEDVSESGRYGERWRVSLPSAVKSWIETFGPHFLTKDLLDFCTGWLQTAGPEFCKAAVPRLVEIIRFMIGVAAAEHVSAVAQSTERPLHVILGNACRSWFSLTNAVLEVVVTAHGPDDLDAWHDQLDIEQFRTAALLSHLASPIGLGEAEVLFSWTSLLIKTKDGPSRAYRRSMEMLLVMLEYGETGPARQHARSLWYVVENQLSYPVLDANAFRTMPAPMEAILADLEDSIQCGFERSPLQDAMRKTGAESFRASDIQTLREHLARTLKRRLHGTEIAMEDLLLSPHFNYLRRHVR